MKIPWEWTWEKYVEKSRKVENKMQSASNFFPLWQKWGMEYGFWRRHECWRKVGRKICRKYRVFFRKILFPKWVGSVGAGLVRPVRTCWDRFGPIFIGKMHIKICRVFWVIHIFKMALYCLNLFKEGHFEYFGGLGPDMIKIGSRSLIRSLFGPRPKT